MGTWTATKTRKEAVTVTATLTVAVAVKGINGDVDGITVIVTVTGATHWQRP